MTDAMTDKEIRDHCREFVKMKASQRTPEDGDLDKWLDECIKKEEENRAKRKKGGVVSVI